MSRLITQILHNDRVHKKEIRNNWSNKSIVMKYLTTGYKAGIRLRKRLQSMFTHCRVMCIDELCKIYNKNIDDSVNKNNIWIYVDESPNHNSGILSTNLTKENLLFFIPLFFVPLYMYISAMMLWLNLTGTCSYVFVCFDLFICYPIHTSFIKRNL